MLSSDDVTFAVKSLQHVRGLKESGSLQDPDTAALVDAKRCAVPDFGPADNARRKRRYAIHGTVWNKTVSCQIMVHFTHAVVFSYTVPWNYPRYNSLTYLRFLIIARTLHTKSSTIHQRFQPKKSTTQSRNLWICGQLRVRLSSSALLIPKQKPISWSNLYLVTMETAGQQTAREKS